MHPWSVPKASRNTKEGWRPFLHVLVVHSLDWQLYILLLISPSKPCLFNQTLIEYSVEISFSNIPNFGNIKHIVTRAKHQGLTYTISKAFILIWILSLVAEILSKSDCQHDRVARLLRCQAGERQAGPFDRFLFLKRLLLACMSWLMLQGPH